MKRLTLLSALAVCAFTGCDGEEYTVVAKNFREETVRTSVLGDRYLDPDMYTLTLQKTATLIIPSRGSVPQTRTETEEIPKEVYDTIQIGSKYTRN